MCKQKGPSGTGSSGDPRCANKRVPQEPAPRGTLAVQTKGSLKERALRGTLDVLRNRPVPQGTGGEGCRPPGPCAEEVRTPIGPGGTYLGNENGSTSVRVPRGQPGKFGQVHAGRGPGPGFGPGPGARSPGPGPGARGPSPGARARRPGGRGPGPWPGALLPGPNPGSRAVGPGPGLLFPRSLVATHWATGPALAAFYRGPPGPALAACPSRTR